jgi:O-antigen/teichoic acid export membrane protein
MGAERYGIVVAVVGVVGYFAFLEVGSSWALLRFVPWYQARQDEQRARHLAGVALAMTTALGIVGALIIFALAPIIASLFHVSEDQQEVSRLALQLMAFYLPMMIVAATLSGIGRALGLFRFTATVGALHLTTVNVVWVAVAGTTHDVAIVVGAHIVVGALSVIAWAIAIRRTGFRFSFGLSRGAFGELVRFGGPSAAGQTSFGLLTQLDKPVLGSVLPIGTLPSYAIPFSFALRIMVLSSALASAVFPRVAEEFATHHGGRVRHLTSASLSTVAVGGGAITVGAAVAGQPFLELWINREFSMTAAAPLTALSLGFSLAAYGSIGQLLLDSKGRVRLTAAVSAFGAVVGLTSGVLLARMAESPTAASIGVAAGLGLVGVLALELARRLAVPMQFAEAWSPLISAWLPLAAAGVGAAFVTSVLTSGAVWSVLAPSAVLTGVAYLLVIRARRAGAAPISYA